MRLPRLICWIGVLCAAAVLSPTRAAEGEPASRLPSKVYRFEDLPVKPTPVGQRRDVVDQPTRTLERFESHVSTLRPGLMSHPPHKHPQEEFIILKEGTLDVTVNGRTQTVGPGSLFFFAANDLHNVHARGDSAATYLVFNLATAATRTAPAEGAEATGAKGVMGSVIHGWERLTVTKTKTGERRELFNSPTTTCHNLRCHVTTLNAGEAAHAPHRHPDEEIIVVKEGRLAAMVNGVTTEVGPGSICFFASNDEHGLKNIGDSAASYYVIRVATELTPKSP